MKFFEKESHLGDRVVYRVAGVRIFSHRLPPVKRLVAVGEPVVVIREPSDGNGLFFHFNNNLGWMRWAEEHGYRCYIDMRTPRNVFHRDHDIDFNPWDFFFKQRCTALDIAEASKVFTNARFKNPPLFPFFARNDFNDQNDAGVRGWREFVARNIVLSDRVAAIVEDRYSALFGGSDNVLGCFVRGTDYTKLKPSRHFIQPTPEQVMADARRICDERRIERIFLATEDCEIKRMFSRAFGDRLISSQTELPNYHGTESLARDGALGDGVRTLEIQTQYLVSMVLLSRCRHLLAGLASGSIGAAFLSHGFETMRFYNLGFYP